MKKTILFAVVLSFMLSSFAYSLNISTIKKVAPSELITECNNRKLVEAIVKNPVNSVGHDARGFTTGFSKENGSFLLGSDFYSFEAFIFLDAKNETMGSIENVIADLSLLGAPDSLKASVTYLRNLTYKSADIKTLNSTAIPVIRPFIDEFIEKEGITLFYTFGEWSQAAYIAAYIGETTDIAVTVNFLKNYNSADFFLTEFKKREVPKGIIDSLETIAALKTKEVLGEEDVKTLSMAMSKIFEITL